MHLGVTLYKLFIKILVNNFIYELCMIEIDLMQMVTLFQIENISMLSM